MQSHTFPSSCTPRLALLLATIVLMAFPGCSSSGSNNSGGDAVAATITWPAPAAIPYGTPLSATQLDATANTAGTFLYTPALGTVPFAGTTTLTAIFLPSTGSTYISASASVSLTVSKITPTITWPQPAGISTLTPLGTATLDATASVPGTLAYTPGLGTTLAAGTDTLSVTFTPTDAVDYNSVTQTVTVSVVAGVPSYTWNSVRVVAGGFVTGIVAHPTQANLRYARTDIGGAYRWDPVNSIWVPLLDFLTSAQDNLLGVEAIGLDPTNPQNLYLACGTYAAESFATNGAMLLSTNQGANFTIVNVPFKIGSNDSGRHAGERLAVDPHLPSTLYYGTRLSGLWRSTNSGASWSQVTSFPITGTTSGVGIVFVDFVSASGPAGSATPVIYVGVSDGGAAPTNYATLYRSVDAGTTWQAVPAAPASLTGMYPSHGVLGPDGALYLSYSNAPGPTGISAGALWQYALPPTSSPGGAGTWTNITPGSPARLTTTQGGFGAIAVDPERPGVLMASTMDDYSPADDIYRSTNYGASWVSLNQQGKTHNYALSPWLSYHNPGATTGTGNWPGTLLIDPFNSSHFLYGNGQTLWDSANIQVSDSGTGPAFSIGALGIEESSISALSSPGAGAALLSGMGDITGMVHTSVSVSPASGMIGTSADSKVISIDWAQTVPLTVVITGVGGAAYATDGGVTSASWKNMTLPSGSIAAQGTIAIAADASTIVWATSDGPVAYSTNNGTSWTISTGAITQSSVFADRVNPKKFYILSGATLQISTDGGHTFANVYTLPGSGTLAVSPAAEGDLWVALGSSLMHSTNSGTSFSGVSGLTSVSRLAFGQAISSSAYPAIYAIATASAGTGFYRSINGGLTWVYMNDAAHQFAYTPWISGDPKIYGRVYIGTNGRGILYGDSPF